MKNEATETKSKSTPGVAHLLTWILYCGALVLIGASAPAQNLFVASDAAGSISDTAHGNIYEFTPTGARSTFASGLFGSVAFDKEGNLFVTADKIYKFTPSGTRTTFASSLPAWQWPLACDNAGNLFVATGDSDLNDFPINGSGQIYKFTPAGVQTTFASGLDLPTGLAFDSAGNLFVANVHTVERDRKFNGAIYKFTPNGVRTTFASGLANPEALAFDNAGNLFVSDAGPAGVIHKFTPSGVRSTFASGFIFAGSLACDSAGNVFVADSPAHAIFKISPAGMRSTFAATDGVNMLAFQPPQTPTPTLVNISTRGTVETGDNVLISGFIVSGSDSTPVIIRGLGSTLTSFGVPDALQDPMLELHNTASIITSNDDWQSAANASQVPTNYRPADSRESAVMTTLQPGSYTAVMHGKNSTTGIGLLDVYSTSSGLTNVSTRGFVGTGDNVLIGGFISSGGNGSIQVIIRALGPTLSQFGVSGTLADPTLTLVNGNGNVIASNDNWKNTQQSAIQTTGFAPPNDLESAILATLPNGNYTAIVAGKNGTTGVGLFDVYKVALATAK